MRVLRVALGCVLLLAGPAAAAGEWKWELTPYIWGSDAALDGTINDVEFGGEADFSDLVDKLEIGGLVHFEGHRERWGFFLEANYFEFADDQTIMGHPQIEDGTDAHADLDMLIAEAGGSWKILGADEGLELLFGLRSFDMGLDVDTDSPTAPDNMFSRDTTLLDGFVGLRHRSDISPRWCWFARIDAGTGDTELSWQAIVGAGVHVTKSGKNTLLLAYRHLEFELDDGASGITGADLELSGPLIGFRFGF